MKPKNDVISAAVAVALSGGLAALPSQAQLILEEVIVTAQKRTENLQDVPISINAFTETALTNYRLDSVMDLGAYTPGLETAPAAGVASGTRVWIRGIGTGQPSIGIDPRVALYTDGIYLGKTPGLAFDSLGLQRIEVLKGPQGTLYGRNAVGGAINLISKRASAEALSGDLLVGGGNFGFQEIKGSVNVPLGDSFAVMLSGMTKERDGWVENDGPGPDFNGYERDAVRFDVRWEPTDTLVLDYAYEKNESDLLPRYSQSVGVIGRLAGVGALINSPISSDRQDRVTTKFALEETSVVY